MASLFAKDVSLNKLVDFSMKCCGLINDESKKWFPLLVAYQWINIFGSEILSLIELIFGSKELNKFVATLSTAVFCTIVGSKLILFATKRKEICELYERLEIIRMKMLEDKENNPYVTKAENIGRKILAVVFITYGGFPIQAFILKTTFEIITNFRTKSLLVKVYLPWSREKNWAHVLSNLFITVLSVSVIFIMIAIYFMEITFTLYISAYIKTLQNNLINKGIRNKEIYEHHKVIIQLINDYNGILSRDFYLEVVIAPLIPCGFGLEFLRAIQKKEYSESVQHCFRATLSLWPCIISCCTGQMITSEMERLHEASYMSNWYEEEPKIRKDLLRMMIRTTSQTTINYRLFVKFDHITLSAVFQVIYSYFMLMINLDEQ